MSATIARFNWSGAFLMDRTDESLIALRRILRKSERYSRELAQAAGLTAVQFRVLQIISEMGGCTPKDISLRMRVSQATVTSLVHKLVNQGMVSMERSAKDGRQKNITVTDKGREAIERAPDALQQLYVRKFEALADWEQAQLVASLERVADMLDAEDTDIAPVLDHRDFNKPE